MLWWFERNGIHMHVEILPLAEGGWEFHVVDSSGQERVERVGQDDLAARQKAIVDDLAADGWHRTGHWTL